MSIPPALKKGCALDKGLGRSRGGFSTKIHLRTNGLGMSVVERRLSKLKHSRRLATRYDKTADCYLGSILVAAVRLCVRYFVNRS